MLIIRYYPGYKSPACPQGCHERLWQMPFWNPHPMSRIFLWRTRTSQKKKWFVGQIGQCLATPSWVSMLTLLPFVSTVILSVAMLQASWGWCQAYPWCTCSIPLLSHLKSKTFAFPPYSPPSSSTQFPRALWWLSNLSAASPLSTLQVTSSDLCATLGLCPADRFSCPGPATPPRQSLALLPALKPNERYIICTHQ